MSKIVAMDINDFKANMLRILEVPSYFGKENRMINRIEEILSDIPGVTYRHDKYGNVYATKGVAETYPLVMAHTDTVHEIVDYEVVEFHSPKGVAFKAQMPNSGMPTGIGGDNKTGIITCLELLKSQDTLKAVFCVAEEFGFWGASLADSSFFTNVGYALEFDAPENFWVSHTLGGIQLFDPAGEFWNAIKPIMDRFTGGQADPWRNTHPYTDMLIIKAYYDFSCINFSSGYINMHSKNEYVVVDMVLKAIATAQEILATLGNNKFTFAINGPKSDQFRAQRENDPRAWELIKYIEEDLV